MERRPLRNGEAPFLSDGFSWHPCALEAWVIDFLHRWLGSCSGGLCDGPLQSPRGASLHCQAVTGWLHTDSSAGSHEPP